MRNLWLLFVLCLPAAAQVETRVYPQPLRVGSLTVLGVDVCNGSDQMIPADSGLVRQQAAQQGYTLALPTTILSEAQNAQPKRVKRLALYIVSALSAGAVALAGGNVFRVSADTALGKAYYGTLSGVAVFTPILATQIEKLPEGETQVDMQRLVQGVIEIPAHRCVSFVHPGIPR